MHRNDLQKYASTFVSTTLQDICVNNFGFKVIRECKVNQFIAADGRRPYSFAPDHIVASLCIRPM